ncbi:MAG: NAD-dependent epimerase/dehydratase family protein [Candidatus Brocadiales bacterium]|nr:NAD-dependent epimerase/dehydratase family protein [Candidatus Brocadiales bacterium]
MKQKTILITGATGFLGSYVTRELFDAGFYLKLLVGKTGKSAKERLYEVFPVTQFEITDDENQTRNIIV